MATHSLLGHGERSRPWLPRPTDHSWSGWVGRSAAGTLRKNLNLKQAPSLSGLLRHYDFREQGSPPLLPTADKGEDSRRRRKVGGLALFWPAASTCRQLRLDISCVDMKCTESHGNRRAGIWSSLHKTSDGRPDTAQYNTCNTRPRPARQEPDRKLEISKIPCKHPQVGGQATWILPAAELRRQKCHRFMAGNLMRQARLLDDAHRVPGRRRATYRSSLGQRPDWAKHAQQKP